MKTATHWSNLPDSWKTQLFGTPLKCHLVGATLSLVLVIINCWIWIQPELLSPASVHSDADMAEAVRLISSRDQIRQRYVSALGEQSEYQDQIAEVESWLPVSHQWSSIRSKIQSLCAESEVQLVGIDQGNEHFGVRVAVMETRCEVQGRYTDICQFVAKLHLLDSPVWCDEIRVVRSDDAKRFSVPTPESDEDVLCLATLSIRIPFVGEGTTAAKLFQRRKTI